MHHIIILAVCMGCSSWYTYAQTIKVTRIVVPAQVAADAASYRDVMKVAEMMTPEMIK